MSDAVEVPPWREDMGRPPRVTVYPTREAPQLQVRVDGVWRDASVMARHDWPSGMIAVQTTIRLPALDLEGRLETYCRTYLWDPDAMHVRSTTPPPEGEGEGTTAAAATA